MCPQFKEIKMVSAKEELPLVSVAVPVHNEGKHIKETLESLCNQIYPNLEILISDNASTDKTAAICKLFAEQDPRIRFIQQPTNIGVSNNFYMLASLAKGKYLIYAAGHDLWTNNLISQCVALLEESDSTVLAYGRTCWLDINGDPLPRSSSLYDTRGADIITKFLMVFWGNMNPFLGVIKRELMPTDSTYYNFIGSDLLLLIKFILMGDFACTTSATYFRRQNRLEEDFEGRVKRYKSDSTKIKTSGIDKILPVAKIPFRIINTIRKSRISFYEKVALTVLLIPSFPIKYLIGRKTIR